MRSPRSRSSRHFCRASGLTEEMIDAVATSAIRDASNRDEFLARAREESGLPIRVLSTEQEARYGYIAAVNSTTLEDGYVMDLGGGSLQLVRVKGRRMREWGSWRLGAVRMSERFLPGRGAGGETQLADLRAFVAKELRAVSWIAAGRNGRRVVGIGGALRNLADAAQRAAGVPSLGVQGAVIDRGALEELIGRLARAALRPARAARASSSRAATSSSRRRSWSRPSWTSPGSTAWK